jgi:hypothetical protein
MAMSALLCLHWDSLPRHAGGATAWRLRLRHRRLADSYLAVVDLIAAPYAEETWRFSTISDLRAGRLQGGKAIR